MLIHWRRIIFSGKLEPMSSFYNSSLFTNSFSWRHFHEKTNIEMPPKVTPISPFNLLQLLSLWKCVNILPLTPLYGRYGTPPQYLEILEGLNYQNTLFTDKLVKKTFLSQILCLFPFSCNKMECLWIHRHSKFFLRAKSRNKSFSQGGLPIKNKFLLPLLNLIFVLFF